MACLDCKFFLEGQDNSEISDGFAKYDGLCKVLPPQITFNSSGDYAYSIWPEVLKEDFCSLWQKK